MILTQMALVEEKATKRPIKQDKKFCNASVGKLLIDGNENIGKIMGMKSVTMPIGKARSDLCRVVKKVQSGICVTLTSHGRPQAVIMPVGAESKPWRVDKPDDPRRYGDLQAPVMEEWQ